MSSMSVLVRKGGRDCLPGGCSLVYTYHIIPVLPLQHQATKVPKSVETNWNLFDSKFICSFQDVLDIWLMEL